MAANPIRTAASAESGVVVDTLLEAIVKRFPFTLNVGESLGDFDFDVGEPPLCVLSVATGFAYFYDATDSTTVDDGLTCLVSGDGRRYKIEDAASIGISSVLSVTATPPGSPVVGDAHICDTASTGAWSGHDADIAIYTQRGWVFAQPGTGMTVYNEGTQANLQFDENGAWVAFAVAVADDSIYPVKLKFPMGVSVEAQQNAPPAVTAGPHYLVGTSGSGDWSGQSNKVAYSTDGSTWSFLTPYEGAYIFNKDTNLPMRYDGSSWGNVTGGILNNQSFTTAGAATWTKPTGVTNNSIAIIELWGAGGGGHTSHGGGGGGAYRREIVPVAFLGATESLSIGAGGTAGGVPTAGGNTTFGSWFTAYGGGPGGGDGGGGFGYGGGGGGQLSAGAGPTAGPTAGVGGLPGNGSNSQFGGGTGSDGSAAGGASMYGGGGGGASTGTRTGGASQFGGGGGAGNTGTGGASKFGGAGGNSGAAGTAPGGGGGANGAGAVGRIVVKVIN